MFTVTSPVPNDFCDKFDIIDSVVMNVNSLWQRQRRQLRTKDISQYKKKDLTLATDDTKLFLKVMYYYKL